MSNVLNIFCGEFGAGVGAAFLKEIAEEHGIIGKREPHTLKETFDYKNSFFHQKSEKEYEARAVYVDYQNTDNVLNYLNDIKELFNSENVVRHGNGNGYFSHQDTNESKDLVDKALKVIRKNVEKMDKLKNIQIISHCAQASCSFSSSLFENLSVNYGQTNKLLGHIGMRRTFDNDNIKKREIFNQVSSTHANLPYLDSVNIIEDECVSKITGSNNPNVNFNLIGRVISDLTSGERSNGKKPFDFSDLSSVPYPRLHYYTTNFSANGLVEDLFNPNFCLGKMDNSTKYKYFQGLCGFRGDFNGLLTTRKVNEITKGMTFGNKIQAYFDSCFVNLEGKDSKRSCFNYSANSSTIMTLKEDFLDYVNNNNVIEGFRNIIKEDGYEEGEWSESIEDLTALLMDYGEVSAEYNENEDEDY